jgi:hypothetical protein
MEHPLSCGVAFKRKEREAEDEYRKERLEMSIGKRG